ncbi:MAG: endonuclease/exonuclease/phosphatase [Micromonosporaceae bacterium]|nr:endonuclease/exonuclease/phosphatase [Micromonosporaceae bacterium]
MTSTYYVAWWNVENLFDEEDSPRRTDKLTRALGASIIGWTPELRDQKINQLASVIARMNAGAGPDLLGVCEVENDFVVDRLRDAVALRLPGRSYAVAHADTVDHRGIDIAFLFDSTLFTAPPDQRFQHVVMRRTATREIFQVNFQTHRGRTWAVFGNHWPSRSGGEHESASYRAIAGETLAYFHQRTCDVHGSDTPALAMGDFNDEPFDPSLVRHALSTRQRAKVLSGTSPRLWNLMWRTLGAGEGTFYFHNFANLLDQFLINKNMAGRNSPVRVVSGSVEVVRPPEMVAAGTYPGPIPFGGMRKPVNKDGYSDHFPIAMRVRESD